jgi:hypothetical protein
LETILESNSNPYCFTYNQKQKNNNKRVEDKHLAKIIRVILAYINKRDKELLDIRIIPEEIIKFIILTQEIYNIKIFKIYKKQ